MPHLNVEIKAYCKNPGKIQAILLDHKADFKGEDHQIDTYFKTPNGRLKLREGTIENNLIHYFRGNQAGPKKSEVRLYSTPNGKALKELLTAALGVKIVVDKKRKIYFINNVKFHIDQVENLGSFVEIEAIDQDGSFGEAHLLKQCQKYLQLFEIHSEDLIEVSYSDLLLN